MIGAATTIVSQLYESRFGWAITPPPGWSSLEPDTEPGPGQPPPSAVTFIPSSHSTVSLLWMYTAKPATAKVSSAFIRETAIAGFRNLSEAAAIMMPIYPLLGELVYAKVLALEDGTKALEIEEEFVQEATGERKKSYQLLFPIHGRPTSPVRFQRLCFYAPVDVYNAMIADIVTSARSFHYRRPFSIPSCEA